MKWFITFIFMTSISMANNLAKENDFSNDELFLNFSGKYFSFSLHKKQKYLLSSHCIKKQSICQAKNALFKKISTTKNIPLIGGLNLGTVVCVKYLGGEIITMKNNKKNKISICKFKDQSMISTGVLEKLLIEK
jgi:hypothetical protein